MDAQDRAGLDSVNRFGLGDSSNAAVDVADEKRAGVSGGFAEIVFGFEQSGGQRAVGIGIDERGISARAIFGAFGNVAAGENGDRAEEMIGILLVNDRLMEISRAGSDGSLAGRRRCGGRHFRGVCARRS